MRKVLVFVALVILSGGAVAAEPVLKVSVLANAQLKINGSVSTLAQLDAALAKLKIGGGVVWYYRESAAGEPPAVAMDAIKLVVKHQLPISMSTKPDFSDAVGPDGSSRPRPNISLQRDRVR
jgi:hypothetical protein